MKELVYAIAALPCLISAKPRRQYLSAGRTRGFLLGLVTEQPDLTLNEIVAEMSKAGIGGSRTAVWRFSERHGFSFKKTLYAAEQKRAEVARAKLFATFDSDLCSAAKP